MSDNSALFAVKSHKHVRIPLSDGVELDAALFLPDTNEPVPAVFDYYPYRKDDLSASNLRFQTYLAQRGYAALRIDVRGTGSSGGTASDEYSVQEQLDAVEAIAWMASQPWCTGKVGMFGTSYGGFNSLQVAMHRPPALKAICPMYFTDNRYTDDCHYKGGALQMLYDVATYGLSMVVQNAMPPYPEACGDHWAEIWEDHLKAEPWLLTWLSNQVYNDYWKQGSLCEDYGSIEAATFLLGGWRDGYTNCNPRVFQHLNAPKKVLIGPWLHVAPDVGQPGPRIDHLHEMARWYDYWLKGIDNGVTAEPPISIYVQQYDPPAAERKLTSGYWRFEKEWNPAAQAQHTLYLGKDHRLQAAPQTDARGVVKYSYNPTVGTTFGMFSAGSPLVTPVDQRLEESFSYSWTSDPLLEPLEILGHPKVTLFVAVSTDIATVSARLIDVPPDDSSEPSTALITKGVINLTHRESHTAPSPVIPGQLYKIELELDATCWHFAAGHRIRVSLAGADFPNTWPSPKAHSGEFHFGGQSPASVQLPLLVTNNNDHSQPSFQPPTPFTPLVTGFANRQVFSTTRDNISGAVSVTVGTSGRTRVSDSVEVNSFAEGVATVFENDPAHATINGIQHKTLYWPQRVIDTIARAQIESTATTFNINIQLEITMNGSQFHQRRWVRSIPRNLL
ncbi:MAG: CocE/NonD family hydrolase [Caldilineaceae bacterium]